MRIGTILAAVLASLLAGCGGSGSGSLDSLQGSSTGTEPAGTRMQSTVITGRVVSLENKLPLSGAQVALGSTTGMTNVDGYFKIVLPAGSTVASLCSSGSSTFAVTIPDQDSDEAVSASYGGTLHPAGSIPLPAEVLSGTESDLGVIAIVAPASDDEDTPPPPPVFEE